LALVVIAIAVMWTIELVDTVLLDDELQGNGIVPRNRSGIDGIAYAPFLHLGWPHLIANTVPFLVLGGLVSLWGWRRWLAVTLIVVIVGGAATWLVARSAIHIGASGVVFGYFGFLLASVFYERRLWPVVPAVIAIVAYGSAVVAGIAPTDGVSWEGHMLGALAGVLAAKVTATSR
jgi:membrane associated rhomboid family serine protease